MRRRFAQALRLFLSAVDRGLMATIGGRHRETWMAVALCAYVAVWTVYGVLAKASQDIHPDMAELVIWSRELAFGYPKHPPFAAWLTKAWFELFPLADWSFYLLGMSIVGLALFTVWRLAEDYVSNDKRVLAVALLTLVPFYNFHALKLNANSILIPLWALTTLAFLRSFERRSVAWSTLAGLFAAAAVLGKYWSFFLLAGLFLAAVVDSRRVTYFRSCAPWVTALVGIAAVTPHVIWLFRHDFIPFTYAFYIHGSNEPGAARGVLGYLAGAAAYVAVPAALAVAATRPHRAALLDLLWPTEPKRRLVVLAFLFPLLLPIVAALLFEVNLNALWTMPAWTLFPIVLLSPPLLQLRKNSIRNIAAVGAAVPAAAVLAAPIVAIVIHLDGANFAATQSQLLAERVAIEWRRVTQKPLRIIGGDGELADPVAFYLPGKPSAFPDSRLNMAPWISLTRLKQEGIAIICRPNGPDPDCLSRPTRLGLVGPRAAIDIRREFLGIRGRVGHYTVMIVPPQP